jgi:hypothetical protein
MSANIQEEVQRINAIADACIEVAAAVKKLRTGKLNDRGLIVLLKAACGKSVPEKHIRTVLQEIENLGKTYTRKEPHHDGHV